MSFDIDPLSGGSLAEELRAIRVVNETAALITSNLELEALVQSVVDIAVGLTGAEFGAFFYNVIGEDGEAFSLYALSGADRSAFENYPHPRATAVFAPTFQGEGVVRSEDIMADPRYGKSAPYHGMPADHLPVRSYLAVPVISRSGEVIGGLFFGHAEIGQFADWHERVVVGIANHAAVGIDNSRLYGEAKAEIRRREVAEARLRETDQRLNAVLNNASVAIFLMNEVQHCVYMNSAAERLTGYTLAETTGRPLHDVIHHTRPDGSHFPLSECAIDRAFPKDAGVQGEEVFVHKDGHFYPVAYTASPVHDAETTVVGTIIEVRDISDEKKNEEARTLLLHEVDHRARNILAIVQSVTVLSHADDLETYKTVLTGRISALGRAQTSLANRRWEDGCLKDVVMDELEALCPKEHLTFGGPPVMLSPQQVQPLSMLIHELATNANKYGACSRQGGNVSVSWSSQNGRVELLWRETGGPSPTVPGREGFGSKLMANVVRQLGGTISRNWEHAGLLVELSFPIQPISP